MSNTQEPDKAPVVDPNESEEVGGLPKIFLVELSARPKNTEEPSERVACGITLARQATRVGSYPNAKAASTKLAEEYDIIGLIDQVTERLRSLIQTPSPALTEITKYYDAWSQLGVVEISGLDAAGQPIVKYELRRIGDTGRLALFNQVELAVGDAKERVQREQSVRDSVNLSVGEADVRPADGQTAAEAHPLDVGAPHAPAPSRARGPGRKGRR